MNKFNRVYNLIMEDLYNFPGDQNLDKNISVKSNLNNTKYDDKKSNIKVDNPKVDDKSDSFGTVLKAIKKTNDSNFKGKSDLDFEYGLANTVTLRRVDKDKVVIRSRQDVQKLYKECKDGIFPYLVIDMYDASNLFRGLRNLKEIKGLDTSKVTNMNLMFGGCINLKSIPEIDTSNVKNMFAMFRYCSSLKSIPQLNTSNVTDMEAMFEDCQSLETIPLIDTHNVRNMYCMFINCYSLKSIPKLNTSNVTDMDAMFDGCDSLKELPQWYKEGLLYK